jgi:tRNA-(ms[2]io[6]A)-hydroxylase
MFALAEATPVAWAATVLPHVDVLLLEQAHLERKAASAALTFLFSYQDHPELQQPLSALAREELEHFELVLLQLRRRGVPFGRLRPSDYHNRLRRIVRGGEPHRAMDHLLVCGIIEARSCERMQLLAGALRDREPDLADMYRDLVRSEARHAGLYVRLARRMFSRDDVDARLRQIALHEAAVLRDGQREPRLHGGSGP